MAQHGLPCLYKVPVLKTPGLYGLEIAICRSDISGPSFESSGGLAFDSALESGILLLPRESDGDGIGLPNMRRSAAIEPFDAAFLWLIAKGGHILPPL